jgi:hypothetical protein
MARGVAWRPRRPDSASRDRHGVGAADPRITETCATSPSCTSIVEATLASA